MLTSLRTSPVLTFFSPLPTFLWKVSVLFVTATFLAVWQSLSSPASPGCKWGLQTQQHQHSLPAIPSAAPLMFDSNFTSSNTAFPLTAALVSLLASFLFWWSLFVKCHLCLSLGTRKQHSYPLCCLYEGVKSMRLLFSGSWVRVPCWM